MDNLNMKGVGQMNNRKKEHKSLVIFTMIGTILWLFIVRKPPVKSNITIHIMTSILTTTIDKILVELKFLKYPVRFFPKVFNIHIVFDLLLCPVITIAHFQISKNDKNWLIIFIKLLFFTTPQLLIEIWAVNKTRLIQWKNGWKWYHTYVSMNIKFFLVRMLIHSIEIKN
jgi:hypothetical protein